MERDVRNLLVHWYDGRIKFLVTTCGLRFRRQHPALMVDRAYDRRVRVVRRGRIRPFPLALGDGIADLSGCTALGACR